ncbi:hypothetical protein [uncultured Mediterranean phage uvMED]|nr:hypothetical protein [uncultured Mediterranean phage uvMED]
MEDLIKSIYKNPEDWRLDIFTFNHKKGFELWVANGFFFAAPYESGMHISFIQKIRIWRAYKWWCKHAPVDKAR